MGSFLLCIVQYLIIAICTLAIGLCGGFIGVQLRKKKNEKKASLAEEEE